MGRPPCCDKLNVKRGLWTPEEDAKILAYVANHGIGNWTLVPQKAGLNRCGKSCRLRWTNYLRPDLKHDNFTPEEEQLILDYHQAIGSRWSLIAKQLPGRTDNDVKNYWNTKLKKKLCKMGIDPVTHKPISQILSDYGKIRGLPNTRNQIGSLNNSMNDMSILTSEHSYPSLVPVVRTELPNSTDMNNKPGLRPETNYHSWDNVAKFHNINQEAIQPHFFPEVSSSISSSSSSSSSSVSSACQPSLVLVTPSSSSSWSEFLLGDPVLSIDVEQKQEQDRLPNTLQNKKPLHKFTTGDGSEFDGVAGDGTKRCSEAAASSSANSFVEAILDRDSEMQLEFPEFLTEYLNP